MSIDELRTRIHSAWSAKTSASPEWSAENPALGQCAVTALVVQDHMGGILLRGMAGDVSHYWNKLPDGSELDLTFQQFPPGVEMTEGEPRDREYVMSFPDTARRYEELQRAVGPE